MSAYGREEFLFAVQDSLLQARDARKDSSGDALFGPKNDFPPPNSGSPSFVLHTAGKVKFKQIINDETGQSDF